MSKLETPMTRRYWKRVGGTLLEEFLVCQAALASVRGGLMV